MSNGRTRMVELLRGAILAGEWVPGQRLQPKALSERFDTSTTVVREALTLLAGDGLLRSIPNRGFFVPELWLRELRDITELRCVTEELGATLAVERGGLEWESQLMAAHHRLARVPRRLPRDPDRINPDWASAHREFHRLLLSACDCEPIVRLASNLADSTELYRRWAAASPAAGRRGVEEEHARILDAALAHDGPLLGSRLRSHYQATMDVVLAAGLMERVRHTRA